MRQYGVTGYNLLSFQASTVLAKSTLEKHSLTSTTLPEDLHYDFNSLLKLFLKPKLLVSQEHDAKFNTKALYFVVFY